MKAQNPSRRDFLRTSAFVGGAAAVAGPLAVARDLAARAEAGALSPEAFYELSQAENIVYTTCMNCNTGCAIKAKFSDGVLVKVDGSPFSPWTMAPHIDYAHSPANPDVAKLDGAICPKGQAGIQVLYDPYRIRRVLKRNGPRGSGEWISIPFEQAVREVVDGGRLFAHVPGEEDRHVEGLRDLYALRDPAVARAMADDVKAIQDGSLSVAEFKERHAEHLHTLIDPDHPDLGPKNNQFVFNWGRMKGGRSQFVQRFVSDAFGSVNRHGHTTVCQGSLYFACKAMSEQYEDGKWTGGQKFYWQADVGHAEFVIFVGSNAFEGGYGPPLRTPRIMDGLVDGRLKFAVVDPRMGKLGGKAWKWVPARPGTEGAMALALIRWVIDNERYDARYLAAANKAAATEAGEPNWSTATWLVKIADDGTPGDYLRATEAGLGGDRFVVMQDGRPVAVTPADEATAVTGDLFVDTTVGGFAVKSVLQLVAEEARTRTMAEWAEVCDVRERDLIELAEEFTSHGKRACADIHRGVSQHTNGYYNVAAWMTLNALIGNIGWKGGMSQPATYNLTGGGEAQPFDMGRASEAPGTPSQLEPLTGLPAPVGGAHPRKAVPFGLSLIRHEANYEKSTLFDGYPARRPWYPLASDIYQEVIPSIGDQYPYPVKALLLYMGAPNYALPAGDKLNAILSDTEKLPLFLANDITIGATSAFADYIFPDGTFYERWEFHGTHGTVPQRVQPIRHPIVTPLVETATVYGEEMPLTLETMLMAFAERLELPGFGPDGLGPGRPLTHYDHFYLKLVANVATDRTPVPDATDEEERVFLASHRHIARHSFDPERWRAAVGEAYWRKVVYVLARGGRFQTEADTYRGERMTNAYNRQLTLYHEKTARTRSSMTGAPMSGLPRYVPLADALGRALNRDARYPLHLSTYRQSTQTKSRTNVAYWLLAISPENAILINRITAQEMGLADGDLVRITSPSNPAGEWDLSGLGRKPVAGRLRVVEGVRPGLVTFSLGFGQWGNGARDMVVDDQRIRGDERRGRGIHANAVMDVDPHLTNTCLTDPVGASAVFYDTMVGLERITERELVA
ncbi:MAG: molybdopterin-dependent oxidoreductase [Rubricoccaceae bacterium]